MLTFSAFSSDGWDLVLPLEADLVGEGAAAVAAFQLNVLEPGLGPLLRQQSYSEQLFDLC